MSCNPGRWSLCSGGGPLPVLVLLLVLGGCGKQGPPLPPVRYVPAPTQDLSIHQQGSELIFELGYPTVTLSGQPLAGLEAVEIWELVAPLPDLESLPTVDAQAFAQAAKRLLRIAGPELESAVSGDRLATRLPLKTPLPERPELHVFAVRSVSSTLEVSSFSNTVQLILRAVIPPPHSLRVAARAAGVELSWEDEAEESTGYHVYRRPSQRRRYGPPLERLDTAARRFLDHSARYGNRYIYTVRSIASQDPLVESAPAGEQEIDYQDRFAPAPPRSLLALSEQGQIRLIWEASPDDDAVGYHLYRQDLGSDFRRITEQPVAQLEYLDRGLTAGLGYVYRAAAVDDTGNEGEPGETATATVQ